MSLPRGKFRIPALPPRWQAAAEVLLVFAVFFVQGAWPVPDVNEPYYLGKAIHFWNPSWAAHDAFLNSADAHQVFYFTFGWLSLLLGPTALAWTGRLLTWLLLAWAWRRLSWSVAPSAWLSVLTAALFACLSDRANLAGEWVIGGVEAKGFAYVLVLLGLEALVRDRWNAVWLYFGAAAAMHVLVGGWSVIAAGLAWLALGKARPALRPMTAALAVGFLLSLPGLVPSLRLTWGMEADVVAQANRIYAFDRLAHHLVPGLFSPLNVARFLALVVAMAALDWWTPSDGAWRRLRMFVWGALALAAVGGLINCFVQLAPDMVAGLLRYYWFRLADVAVPLFVALLAGRFFLRAREGRPGLARLALGAMLVVTGLHVGVYGWARLWPTVPRADQTRRPLSDPVLDNLTWPLASSVCLNPRQVQDYVAWRRACAWVSKPGNVPPGARFLTPRMSSTFKWYTGRSEVATSKDIPQDARSIVEWWHTLLDVYVVEEPFPDPQTGAPMVDAQTGRAIVRRRWCLCLPELGEARLVELGRKYGADYVLTVRRPRLNLEIVYESPGGPYVIYRLPRRSGAVFHVGGADP